MGKKFNGHCDHKGQMTVQRLRGSRQRQRCTVCLYWGPWEPRTDAQKAAQQPAKVSVDLSACTVAELRQKAKERSLTGYSKMTKGDLVAALGG